MRTATKAVQSRRQRSHRGMAVLASTTAVALSVAVAAAQVYQVSRWSIDAGGLMRSHGGDFELSGSTAQADAGGMSGGGFHMTGGFWFEVSPTDCNEDGLVNLLDGVDFVSCMMGPGSATPADRCRCFDVDLSGAVDLSDFANLQAAYRVQ